MHAVGVADVDHESRETEQRHGKQRDDDRDRSALTACTSQLAGVHQDHPPGGVKSKPPDSLSVVVSMCCSICDTNLVRITPLVGSGTYPVTPVTAVASHTTTEAPAYHPVAF